MSIITSGNGDAHEVVFNDDVDNVIDQLERLADKLALMGRRLSTWAAECCMDRVDDEVVMALARGVAVSTAKIAKELQELTKE